MQGSGGLLRGVDALDELQQTAVPPLGGRGPGGDGVPGALGELDPGRVAARPGLWVETPLPKCPASPFSLLTSQQPTPWAEGSWRGPPPAAEKGREWSFEAAGERGRAPARTRRWLCLPLSSRSHPLRPSQFVKDASVPVSRAPCTELALSRGFIGLHGRQ